ncbi:Lsr2 family protein [Arthrobacter sp. ISL-65]|uniref:histone-like nucleoid-structuring protein Lsr2 n=1 Tax=Arthrobacter sp. ISL-65 TaxID=2819112 RepID=UPI001BEBC928|nr:Lsr2 family protein [Arthrobacter sp. ISL-65]MBT2551429.1 Lsr2 family protein [Arthrobacter sp. ISL-65]
MARKTVISLEDDLDGSEASETVQFAIDGTEYEIDLNEEHASELRQTLSRFADAARKSSGSRGRPAGRRSPSSSSDAKVIRQWALNKGLSVNARGRIQADIVAQYQAAH